jgi:hypothetical protein
LVWVADFFPVPLQPAKAKLNIIKTMQDATRTVSPFLLTSTAENS